MGCCQLRWLSSFTSYLWILAISNPCGSDLRETSNGRGWPHSSHYLLACASIAAHLMCSALSRTDLFRFEVLERGVVCTLELYADVDMDACMPQTTYLCVSLTGACSAFVYGLCRPLCPGKHCSRLFLSGIQPSASDAKAHV